jgi:NADH pyrophosphatase NudC (nudix superfamily)
VATVTAPDPNEVRRGGPCPTCGTTVEDAEGETKTGSTDGLFIEVLAMAYRLKPCGHMWYPPVRP